VTDGRYLQDSLPFDICANRHGGDECSAAANESIREDKSVLRGLIREMIRNRPLICEEIEAALSLKHQTVSARISELKAMGLIRASGAKRATSSGRMAHVLESCG
jgi:predicted transcriptional regulator